MELGSLTVADLEDLANRLGKAVATIKEAQALLGVVAVPAMHPPTITWTGPAAVNPPANQFTPSEAAERERLMAQFRDKLPDTIKKLEEA